ncbi:LytTR family transcriptional regulator DNA-binding domain-containing protein [Stakelama tenebrarum]|uniref:HTH LytTR-type domain-containing protein n=1 Tax=Stakelama tenebrarum TaxID=2711215 RepID=A0A6G6Y253_9SPHN|nr:LytTR family transcriptional regulator DNA-binding domain-containing protein [Sphingosinithalassobacter tenebrarum]QIG78979.1 hypothetical protein G5C33_03710 [Sphingosinithalassobacter tenebrarum]
MREMQRFATGASRMAERARPDAATRQRRGFVIVGVAALLMTITGAFGTHEVPILPRLAYWMIIMVSGAMIGIGVTAMIVGWGRFAHRPWIEGSIISVAIALPLTLVVIGCSIAFFGGGGRIGPQTVAFQFVMVLAITAVITAVNYAIGGQAEPDAPLPAEPEQQHPVRPRLADRLPPHLRGADIHAVAAEDHYLRVHTDAGSDLILLRLTDAIVELDGIEGARTHRSWWVARDAIRSVERGDGRAELTLPGGVTAPVSRSFYPALRDAGWFD